MVSCKCATMFCNRGKTVDDLIHWNKCPNNPNTATPFTAGLERGDAVADARFEIHTDAVDWKAVEALKLQLSVWHKRDLDCAFWASGASAMYGGPRLPVTVSLTPPWFFEKATKLRMSAEYAKIVAESVRGGCGL